MERHSRTAWNSFRAPPCGLARSSSLAAFPATRLPGIKEASEAASATLLYLPPYSPVLNPIGKVFSKRKAILRGLAPRTKDSLWDNVGALLKPFSPQKCKNYFTSCRYVSK
jgi:transposase